MKSTTASDKLDKAAQLRPVAKTGPAPPGAPVEEIPTAPVPSEDVDSSTRRTASEPPAADGLKLPRDSST